MPGMKDAIYELMDEKGMTLEQVKQTISQSLVAAYKKKFGTDENAVVIFSDDLSSVSLFSRKTVVDAEEDELNHATEISLREALTYSSDAEEGDLVDIPVDPKSFDRGSVQSGKQKHQQASRDIQKNAIYNEFKKLEGKIVPGIILNSGDPNDHGGEYIVNISRDLNREVRARLPRRNQSSREKYGKGEKIKCILDSVNTSEKDPKMLEIILSRASTLLVEELMKENIPELSGNNPTIGIYKIVREAGHRTKVAVYTDRDDIDPVGTCVGFGGQRIKNIITELSGELIDVLRYDPDPATFIANALSPARVSQVYIIDQKLKHAVAIVDDDQLSFAIGRLGLNVKLVNRLCDWNVEVKTMDQFQEMDVSKQLRFAADQLFDEYEEEGEEYEEAEEVVVTEPEIAENADEQEEEELMLSDIGLSASLVKILQFYDIYSVEEYIELTEEDFANMKKLSSEQKAEIDRTIAENVDFVETDEEGEQGEEIYQCPNCGAVITPDMTECPNCHVGLSFE